MKNTIALIFLILIVGCKSNYNQLGISEEYSGKKLKPSIAKDTTEVFVGSESYQFFKYNRPIKFKLIGYETAFQYNAGPIIPGLPTTILIGKTFDKTLPDTLTMLAISDFREFKFGEILFAFPDKINDTTDVQINLHVIGDKNPKPKYIPGSKFKAFLSSIRREDNYK